jgi:hypothetical protein
MGAFLMYVNQIVLKNLQGELVAPRVGDELMEPGLPAAHKRSYVGPIGLYGENVVDPAKGQAARLVHLYSIPNWQQLIVCERGPEDWDAQARVQERAREVLANGVVNRTLGPNCEHISSYIRAGSPKSPQLRFWGGVAAVVAFGLLLANAD